MVRNAFGVQDVVSFKQADSQVRLTHLGNALGRQPRTVPSRQTRMSSSDDCSFVAREFDSLPAPVDAVVDVVTTMLIS